MRYEVRPHPTSRRMSAWLVWDTKVNKRASVWQFATPERAQRQADRLNAKM